MLLAADIGGTKADCALFTLEDGPRAPRLRRRLPSRDHESLAALVRAYLDQVGVTLASLDAACFDVPGPVVAGRASLPNLGFDVDEATVCELLGLTRVVILNDLAATATALPLLEPAELRAMRAGETDPQGAIAVIAPGTGLGEGFLTWTGSGYQVHPSEGGHGDFAPTGAVQVELLEYLWERFEHVSYERVCSGTGIPNLYDFLRDRGERAESPAVAAALAADPDRTPVIVAAATDARGPDPLCRAAIELFLEILGAEAGNLALRLIATGGVYVAGGLPPRVLDVFESSRFDEAFVGKGRQAELARLMPVHVVLDQVALYGAAARGLDLLR